MSKHLKILFAEKLPDGKYSIYGNIVLPEAINAFKDKVDENIYNRTYIATVAHHADIPIIRAYDNAILYRITGYSEEPSGFYVVVEFENNPASLTLFGMIKSGTLPQFNIRQLGKISTAEAFHDEYLAKSLQFKFFRWLRRTIPFIDNYYNNHSFHLIVK